MDGRALSGVRIPGTAAVLKNNVFAWTASGWLGCITGAHNNLFYGGTVRLERYAAGGVWTLRDNAFDSVALTNANAAVGNDHNGYLGLGQAQLPGSGGERPGAEQLHAHEPGGVAFVAVLPGVDRLGEQGQPQRD